MAVQINVQANQAALTASIAAGVQAFNRNLASQNQLNLSINSRGFSQPLGRITGDVKDFEAALAASNARVIAFGASTAVLGGVIRTFKELATTTIDVEKNLTDISRVFGLTTTQLQKFSTELFQVSKITATSFNDASKAALEFSRQGLAAEETLQRTKDALTLARLAGVSYANAVDALTSTVNGFADSGVTTTQILNKLVAVEQDFAVGAGDLADALSRTGQAAQEAGVSLDQLNALVTAAQERTARGGAVIGNALKTIFTRLQRTETLDQLEAFNIAVRDVQGNILPAVTILQNFANSYDNLADSQRAQLAEQVAGVYQVNILKAIVNDLNNSQGVYARALEKGAGATNEAEIATAKLNQTLDALLNQTATGAQQLANNIGKITFAPLAKEAVSVGNIIIDSLNNILEGEGVGNTFAVGFLKGIRNFIAGPGAIAAFFTLFKLIQNSFTYLTQALPQIAGITTETQNRKNIEKSILDILNGQSAASRALMGLGGNQVAQAQLLLQIARQQTAEYQTQQALAKNLARSLSGQGVIVRGGAGLQVTRSSGYIPTSTKMVEKIGAFAGGYNPGNVIKAPSSVGGVMNSAEEVKYVPGFAQPFINPPINSQAGRSHRQNSIKKTGVDPYMYDGFIPNFALSMAQAKAFESPTIQAKTNPRDKFLANINPVRLPKDITQYRQQAENIIGASAAVKRGTVINGGIYVKQNKRNLFDGSSYNRDNLDQFIKTYKDKVSESTLKRTITSLKNLNGDFGYSLNQVQGLLGEADAKQLFKNSRVTEKNDFFDLIKDDGSLAEVRTRKKIYTKDILEKAILERLKIANYKNRKIDEVKLGSYDVVVPKRSKLSSRGLSRLSSNGFIPNFAGEFAGAAAIRAAVESGIIENYKIPGSKTYRFPDGKIASESQVIKIAERPTKGTVGKPGEIKFAGGPNYSATPMPTGERQLIDQEYENFLKTKIPGLISAHENAINFSLPFTGGGNSYVDFFNPATKTFYEAKGGSFTSAEVANKFASARTDLQNQLNKQLQEWKNVLLYNPDYAAGGFIPNFAKFKSKYGTATLGKTDPIDLEYFSKTLGRKIKASDIVSIEDLTTKGKGNAAALYGDIASSIKGKGGIFGYALAQDRAVKGNDPLARLKARYPQIAKRIGLGGETFISGDYGQTIVRASTIQDLIKYQDQILKMVDPAVLTLKSFSNGFIPNFAIPTVRKGYAFSDGRIFDSFDHSDAWDDIVGPKKGAKKYEYRPDLGTLLIQGEVSEQLRKAFAERHVTSINKVVSLEESMREKNAQDTTNMIKRLGLISLGGGYKAVFEKGLYRRVIKDNKYFDILGGIEPEYIKMLGGIEGFIEREKKKGWLKWEDLPSDFSTGSSNGFIPSFAYKNSVMQLEESLSGEKAILDTKTGPFPFIRNSSQPNFAAAIADHGGLNNALSDSYRNQKAAGLMNKGFIPNFAVNLKNLFPSAPPSWGNKIKKAEDELQKLAEEFAKGRMSQKDYNSKLSAIATSAKFLMGKQNELAKIVSQEALAIKKQAFAEKISKFGTTLAIAGPMLAGFAEQAVFGNRERIDLTATERGVKSALSTGLTSVTTGASIGAAFGPIGAGVGAAAGALFGLTQAFKDAALTTEELNQLNEKQMQKTQENISLGSSYIDAQKQLTQMIADGASSTDIENATKKLSDNFLQIKDVKLQEEFLKAGGDIKIMTEQLQQYTNEQTRKNVFLQSILGNKDIESTASGLFTSLKQGGQRESFIQLAKDVKEFYNKNVAQSGLGLGMAFGGTIDENIKGERLDLFGTQKTRALEMSRKAIQDQFGTQIKSLLASFGVSESDSQYKENFNAITDLFYSKNSEEILKSINKFANLSENQKNKLQEQIKKEGNLYKLRTDIQEQILKNIEAVNQQIMRDEFSQKISDTITNFQESLMSSFVDPLTQISIKQETAVARQAKENAKEIQKINTDFYEKNFSELSKKINNETFITGTLAPAFAEFQKTGDISGIKKLQKDTAINDPEAIKAFNEAILKYDLAIQKQGINNQGQLDILAKQFEVERIKENNNKIMNSILQKEILSLGQSERFELARRTNVELSIDAIERRMSDEARYFGRGVLGKAEKKSAYRTEISRKKIIEDEIQKSMSAQGGYSEIINAQRQALLDQAQLEDAASSLGGGGMFSRAEAENISSIQIKNAQDLAQAIQQTESITFTNAEQERKRLSTIESLKKIQEEINQGKIKEEEITARINDEETQRARRSTSFSYNLKEGFDSINTESELIVARLGKDLPRMFADNMTNALMDIAKGTDNIGDAFMKIATNFGSTILEAIIKANMYKLIGGIGVGSPLSEGVVSMSTSYKQKGGYIRAQNGMYINGTGSGDRYPALLENGEYVLNRNAVMAMGGPATLDRLNFSVAPRFASGGAFSGANYQTLEELEANLTPQGLEQSKLYQDLYSAEKSRQEEAIRKSYERKVRRAQMAGQIAGAVVAIGASYGVSSFQSAQINKVGSKVSTAAAAGQPINLSRRESTLLSQGIRAGTLSPIDGSPMRKQSGGYIGNRLSDKIPAYMSGGLISKPIFNKHSIGMQYGGSPSAGSSNSSLTTNNNNTSNNNSFNFAVNVNRDNKVEVGSSSSSFEQQDVEFSKRMNSQVYATVLEVLRNEKRFGGSLSTINNKRS